MSVLCDSLSLNLRVRQVARDNLASMVSGEILERKAPKAPPVLLVHVDPRALMDLLVLEELKEILVLL